MATQDYGFREISFGSQLDDIKELGTSYFRDNLFYEKAKPPVVKYNRKSLPVGRRVSDGSIFYLDTSEACRVLILGVTRSGKSFLMRGMGDRLVRSDYDVVYLSDLKNEFWSSRKPVQNKFRDMLLEGEEPSHTNVVTLRPTFFKDFPNMAFKHEKNFWFSFDPRLLSKDDFYSIIQIEKMTNNQQIMVDDLYEALMKYLNDNPSENCSYELICAVIDQLFSKDSDSTSLKVNSKDLNALKFKFKPLSGSHLFENKYFRDIINLLTRKRRYVPALNVEGFDDLPQGSVSQYPSVILNIVLKQVINARRDNPARIRPVWVLIDEAARYLGVDKRNSLKNKALESVELDTRYGVNYIYAFQTVSSVPDKILSNSNFIFIPQRAKVDEIKSLIVNSGIAKNSQVGPNTAIRIKNQLRMHPYSWMVINRTTVTMDLIKPLAPLSHHVETK